MALKGKKKSRVRGSQARRRPASAPRPTYGGRDKPRWYQTTTGLVLAFVIVAAAGILLWWFVADNRSEAAELKATQDSLDSYTNSLEAIITDVTPVASDLMGAAELKDDKLAEKTKEWTNQLASAQSNVAQMSPPSGLEALNGLVTQGLLLYVQSTEQYALLPALEGKTRSKVKAKAAASFQAASNIFASAIELLDGERQENEMDASRLTTPGTPTEQVQLPVGGGGAEEGNE